MSNPLCSAKTDLKRRRTARLKDVIGLLLVLLLVAVLITQLILLAGLWDVYKRVRAVEDMLAGKESREASKRLQQVGLDEISNV